MNPKLRQSQMVAPHISGHDKVHQGRAYNCYDFSVTSALVNLLLLSIIESKTILFVILNQFLTLQWRHMKPEMDTNANRERFCGFGDFKFGYCLCANVFQRVSCTKEKWR